MSEDPTRQDMERYELHRDGRVVTFFDGAGEAARYLARMDPQAREAHTLLDTKRGKTVYVTTRTGRDGAAATFEARLSSGDFVAGGLVG